MLIVIGYLKYSKNLDLLMSGKISTLRIKHIFLATCSQLLTDSFIQEMYSYFDNSPKCMLYKHLPDSFCLQYFLRKGLPENFMTILSKFRTSSHELLIEKGRYSNTERSHRKCEKCDTNDIEDEFHFVLSCPLYSDLRKKYIKCYYWRRPSMFKLVQLFSVRNRKTLCNLSRYLINALLLRNS